MVESQGSKAYGSYSYFKTNLQLIDRNKELEAGFAKLSKELDRLDKDNQEKQAIIKKQEEDIVSTKNKLLIHEKSANDLAEQNQRLRLSFDDVSSKLDNQRLTIEVLGKQIGAMTEALSSNESSIDKLLSEKSRLINSKFFEFMQDDPKFKDIRLPEYFKHSYNFKFEPFYDKFPQSQVINPDHNLERLQAEQVQPSQMSDEHGQTFNSSSDNEDLIEEDKINEATSRMSSRQEKPSIEKPSSQVRPSQQMKDSFITKLDLNEAFNNASYVTCSLLISC